MGLVVECPEDLLRMRERPHHGCELIYTPSSTGASCALYRQIPVVAGAAVKFADAAGVRRLRTLEGELIEQVAGQWDERGTKD